MGNLFRDSISESSKRLRYTGGRLFLAAEDTTHLVIFQGMSYHLNLTLIFDNPRSGGSSLVTEQE
jgi:hypothetical protein